jgi:hypothetical protein
MADYDQVLDHREYPLRLFSITLAWEFTEPKLFRGAIGGRAEVEDRSPAILFEIAE